MQDGAGCLAALTHIHSHVKEGASSTGSRLFSSLSLIWSSRTPLVPPAYSADVGTGAQRRRPGLLSTEHPRESGKNPVPLRVRSETFSFEIQPNPLGRPELHPLNPPAPRVQSATPLSAPKLLQLGPGSCSPGLSGLRRLSGLVGEEKKEWHHPWAPLVLGPTQAPSAACSLSRPA